MYEMEECAMKALTYIEHGKFELIKKPKPLFMDARLEHFPLEVVQYRNDTLWLKYKRK